jgi:hypothetical protein
MQLKLISCEIFYREFSAAVAVSPNQVDIEFLPKGLHDIGAAPMAARMQEAIDRVPKDRYDAVLLGYGLCNNGLVGVAARSLPLVLPRAHDCITLFFGSRRRYDEYFEKNPGTYYKTTGWIERGQDAGELQQISIGHKTGMDLSFEELVARYGEDNARFLQDQLCNLTRNYVQLTYIEMGVGPPGVHEAETRAEAAKRDWKFDRIDGDMRLLRRLVDGPWDAEDFLIVPPGCSIAPAYDDRVVKPAEQPLPSSLNPAEPSP